MYMYMYLCMCMYMYMCVYMCIHYPYTYTYTKYTYRRMTYDGAHTYGKVAYVDRMAYNGPLARCRLRPPFHTAPVCRRIHREGTPDWSRIWLLREQRGGLLLSK